MRTSTPALPSAAGFLQIAATAVTALTLAACGHNGNPEIETTAITKLSESAQALDATKGSASYFPSQFPAPDGEIEPLPEQF